MADAGDSNLVNKFDRIVHNHNARPHGGIEGAAPEDVEKDPAFQFRLTEDNAQKIMKNEAVHTKRVDRVEEAGAYREPVPHQTFTRGYHPRFKN